MSGRTLEKATQVISAAQQDPEKYGQLVKKMDEEGKVDGAFRELKRLQNQNSTAATATTSLKEDVYSVIFAIPPWAGTQQESSAIPDNKPSHVMSLKDLKKLKPPIAADAVMFLQTPPSSLVSALELLAAWGFKYRTFLVWQCFYPSSSKWLKEYHRAVLIGVRGDHSAPLPENLIPSLILQKTPLPIHESTIRKHIESMFPGEKYLEVFSKSNRQGWVSWPGRPEANEKLEKTTSGNPATSLK
jgi:N6-adenosine-specific RNA methylase IME4